ncbi:monovalent cation/H(+) antiporter subunit G [Candidatus Aerophobetes bacterium]|nr:monovalent cation/H(+) antiporter subunit G [Candidatus Aerophobetes bacterium]
MRLIAYLFIGMGVFFATFGNIGILRFPDVYTRLQASSKCGITSIISIFIGLMILEGLSFVTVRILVITMFFFITSPVSSHAIGRSAYEEGILPWRKEKEKEKGE